MTTALAGAAAAGLGALAWGSLVERNRFTLRRQVVPILQAGARPLTVLHISDLHMAPWQRAKQEWVRGLAVFEPDLIVNTGDNLGHERGNEGVEYALEPFRGIPGIFVHGSNDYHGPVLKNPFTYFIAPSEKSHHAPNLDTKRLNAFFEGLGWLQLDNTARAMSIKGSRLEFLGVNDAHIGWDKLERIPGAMDEMRENVGWQDDVGGPDPVTIAITHSPYQRVLDTFVTYGAELIFAGHTHGGQVCVPGYGALVTNCDIPREQVSGLSLWKHAGRVAYLNVSAGLGTSIFAPVRFACPPEATLMTLVPRDFSYS
ncbi:metallophosphoesterase [Lacisediminihabitans profunda]|uniref:Metallophosphoesterase n=1 Tax=Lacisediminihabitans profunda TaxID=2594790 RepID=A0A5C8UKU7_9MICO|nr:metallophosphoesterase [Lacisediminihabitans profunda]